MKMKSDGYSEASDELQWQFSALQTLRLVIKLPYVYDMNTVDSSFFYFLKTIEDKRIYTYFKAFIATQALICYSWVFAWYFILLSWNGFIYLALYREATF